MVNRDGKTEELWATGLMCLIITCISTSIQINKHIFDNHHPQIRRYIIMILLTIIMYSGFAFAELLVFQPKYIRASKIIRDIYESIAIYAFYQLLIYSLDGYHNLQQQLSHIDMNSAQYLWLCCRCCVRLHNTNTNVPVTTSINDGGGVIVSTIAPIYTPNIVTFKWIKYITIGVLQFCIIQIILSIALFCLDVIHDLHLGVFAYNIAYGWIIFTRSISQSVAIYCLLLLYFILKSLPPQSLAYKQFMKMRFKSKFVCIAAMIFATFWQRVLMLILVHFNILTEMKAISLQNVLICIEMTLLSIVHWFTYKIGDFDGVSDVVMHSAWNVIFSDHIKTQQHRIRTPRSTPSALDEEQKRSRMLDYILEDYTNTPTKKKKETLRYYHSILITISNMFVSLVVKILIAFIPFIMIDFEFSSFIFVTVSLSIGSLFTVSTCLTKKLLLNLKSNLVFFILCILECVGVFLLWFFNRNYAYTETVDTALFVIAIVILINVEDLMWRCSESMAASMTTNPSTLFKMHVSLNISNAFAAFLLIPSGIFIHCFDIYTYLVIIFPIFICLAIANLFILPKKSVNKYNMIQAKDIEIIMANENACSDLRILCHLRLYGCIIAAALFIFVGDAYFYVSFGRWIIELCNWNPAQFGIFLGVAEGSGRLMSVLMIANLVRRGRYKESAESEKAHRLSQTSMMVWFACILTLSIGVLWSGVIFNFYSTPLMYCMIGLFFCGSQGASIMIMVVLISHVPLLQQRRSLSIFSIIQSIAIFAAQCSIGPIYLFRNGLVLTMLLFIYFVILMIAIWINEVSNTIRLDPESRSITGSKQVPKYG